MNKHLQKLITATATLPVALTLAVPAFAQPIPPQSVNPCDRMTGNFKSLCNVNANNIGGVLGNFILFLFIVAALIALFFLIWGGIKWILSGGDKGKVETARSTIIAALIGLVVTFLSFFLLQIVLGLFGINLSNLQIPQLI